MSLQIEEHDSPTVARLKLLYLVPVFIICFIPGCLYRGFVEWGQDGCILVWKILIKGKP